MSSSFSCFSLRLSAFPPLLFPVCPLLQFSACRCLASGGVSPSPRALIAFAVLELFVAVGALFPSASPIPWAFLTIAFSSGCFFFAWVFSVSCLFVFFARFSVSVVWRCPSFFLSLGPFHSARVCAGRLPSFQVRLRCALFLAVVRPLLFVSCGAGCLRVLVASSVGSVCSCLRFSSRLSVLCPCRLLFCPLACLFSLFSCLDVGSSFCCSVPRHASPASSVLALPCAVFSAPPSSASHVRACFVDSRPSWLPCARRRPELPIRLLAVVPCSSFVALACSWFRPLLSLLPLPSRLVYSPGVGPATTSCFCRPAPWFPGSSLWRIVPRLRPVRCSTSSRASALPLCGAAGLPPLSSPFPSLVPQSASACTPRLLLSARTSLCLLRPFRVVAPGLFCPLSALTPAQRPHPIPLLPVLEYRFLHFARLLPAFLASTSHSTLLASISSSLFPDHSPFHPGWQHQDMWCSLHQPPWCLRLCAPNWLPFRLCSCSGTST